jgi:hypothetical protein
MIMIGADQRLRRGAVVVEREQLRRDEAQLFIGTTAALAGKRAEVRDRLRSYSPTTIARKIGRSCSSEESLRGAGHFADAFARASET